MARCGVRLRHPVFAEFAEDGGPPRPGPALGEAETVAEAAALAERAGLRLREEGARFLADGAPRFVVPAYPVD